MGNFLSRDITSWECLDFTIPSAHQLPAPTRGLTFCKYTLFFLQNAAKYPETNSNKTARCLQGMLFIVFLQDILCNSGIESVEVGGFYLTYRT